MLNNYLLPENDYFATLQKNTDFFNEKVVKHHIDAIVMPKKRVMKISRIALIILTEEAIDDSNNIVLNRITNKILANFMKFEP